MQVSRLMRLAVSARLTWFSLVGFAVLVAAAGLAAQALAEEPQSDGPISQAAKLSAASFQVEPGYTVTPVASEPLFANPVAFCFDPAGRIFIAETHRVHHGTEDNRNHMDWLDDDLAAQTVAQRRAYIERRMADKLNHYTESSELVCLLEDRDGDGVYDHSSIFSEGYNQIEDGAAAGVLWLGDRLWFTCIPNLWELRDADGDGKAEERKSLASGFGVHFALFGHDLHGLTEGPDGKIYFSLGDRGLHVETPNGVLTNPDSGSVLRCNPDGSELELFATGLRNPQELAFNEYGDLFSVDNNSDSGDRARVIQIVEGMRTGWRMSYQYLPDRGPFNREKIWHTQNDEQPRGIVPPIAHISDGPSGLCYYPGTGMTPDCRNCFFLADFRGGAAASGIMRFRLEQQGAGYKLADHSMFMKGILATDCDFGPDGNFYVADWIDGWNGTGMGRFYRIADDKPELVAAREQSARELKEIPSLAVDKLIALLSNANFRVRQAAQRRLVAIGSDTAQPLQQLAADEQANQLARLHSIWALGSLAIEQPALFNELAKLCQGSDAEVRNQAARVLGRARHLPNQEPSKFGPTLVALLEDASLRVRASAATSLGSLKFEPALAALLKAAGTDAAASDPIVRTGIVVGLAGSQPAAALVAAAKDANVTQRIILTLALGKQQSAEVAKFLNDADEAVVLEAAREIWDVPIPAANAALADVLNKVKPTNEPLVRRALAANQAMRTAANLKQVIEFARNPQAPAAMREHAWDLVGHWAEPSPRDPVHGQWRPLAPQPQAEVVAALAAAWPVGEGAEFSDSTGAVVAAELGLPAALNALPKLLADAKLDGALQARAIAALDHADDAIAEQVIAIGLQSKSPAARTAAGRLLAKRFPAKAVGHLKQTAEQAKTAERQAALETLAKIDLPEARDVIAAWMTRVEDGSCPPELLLEVLDGAKASSDKSLVERAERFAAKQAASDVPAEIYASSLAGGNRAHGRELFLSNESLSCRRCHSLKPGEQLVGPSLADVGAKRTPSEIIESITRPNAKVVEGFQTTSMLLDTGMVVTGIIRSEDDKRAVLLNADGKEVEVDMETVEDRVQGLSAMPEDLMKYMSPRDLRDLVAFLGSRRKASGEAAEDSAAGHQIEE
ncbi:PVC-type heme-binding CxxCH protein [Lacipirellula parvula]|uniref:Cytochrome c domain-containing protein n=1 Tax=Lacipirellula parvula TaxID=2650471 RepID=A0A5K7X5Q4_9BACT|nr:PVC-type heme-binding CxxCH protein [Lacipirellula parvula]BBO31177.1 hypothetical protein PLANPX_0789 [Lacipirellula parvula]